MNHNPLPHQHYFPWWRRRVTNVEKGTYTIDTWDDFKKEVKR